MSIQEKIGNIVHEHQIVLFMKGTPDQPMCGFSARVVAILKHMQSDFFAVNVLEDDAIREGIKIYGQWPTIPQLYIKGELIGGCDIVTEAFDSGDLSELLSSA